MCATFDYIVRNRNVEIDGSIILTPEQIRNSILFCNAALKSLSDETAKFDIDIFEALGMRNLSGLIGEYFAKSVQRHSEGKLVSNLHQDGYPDLLLVDTIEKLTYLGTLYVEHNNRKVPLEKESFSPFKYGGIEVKATCGSTPSTSTKKAIGEQRIDAVTGFDWKAHHRLTNNLLSIFWDFIDGIPTVVACFYRNDLTESDWGKIVQPKDGGGRTTSVSIMNSTGVKKMCEGWVAVIDDPAYTTHFAKKKWIGYDVRTRQEMLIS